MQYTVYVTLAPLIAAALLATLAYVWRYRAAPGATPLLWLIVAASGWLVANTLELRVPTESATVFWAKVTYPFIVAVPVAWLVFAYQYAGRGPRLAPSGIALLCVIPVITVALTWTNGSQGLVWERYEFVPIGHLLAMQVTHGAWFWIHVVYCYALVMLGAGVVLSEYVRSPKLYRGQATWAAVGVLLPLITNAIYVFHLIPALRKDYSPIAFAFASAAFVIGMMRYRLFDLKPVARNTVIDVMKDGMLVLDDQGRVVDINRAARDMIGVGSTDVVGESVETLLDPARAAWAGWFRSSGNVHTELSLDQEGGTRCLDLRLSRLADNRGQMTGRLIVLRDITQRKRAELERGAMLTELQQANVALHARNAELDAFAHTVAHDLKNPLGAILGYASFLTAQGELLPVADQFAAIQTIERLALRMDEIIEALLLLAGVRALPVVSEPLDMAEIVARALERLAEQVRQAAATVLTPPTWPLASGYAPWIEEVWYNYLSNALKYGGQPPRVELGAELSTEATPGLAPSDMVRFWVQDNGDGVTAEERDRLFVPFTRLGLTHAEGHGLGLSIARQIVEKSGGQVGVESEGVPGRGSRFYFTLPSAEPVTGDGQGASEQVGK